MFVFAVCLIILVYILVSQSCLLLALVCILLPEAIGTLSSNFAVFLLQTIGDCAPRCLLTVRLHPALALHESADEKATE